MKKKVLFLTTILSLTLSVIACNNSSNEESISSSLEKESSTSNVSSINSSSIPSSTISYQFSDEPLSSNPETCNNHVLEDSIIVEPTIIKRGIMRSTCPNCGGFTESYIYDLNEYKFENKTYVYDGNERELLIEGLLPYGVTVKYENNKLTEIGSIRATASIYAPDGHLLDMRNANLTIIENIGLPNIKITTSTGKDPDYKDKTNYTAMTASIDNCLSQYAINEVSGGIRARGNSTNYDGISKRPWRLKFNSKINLLGLNEGQKFKSWVLLAEYFDQSLYRNAAAYTMGNSLFNYSNNYCSDYQHVNFYLNGDYRGVYVLAEQQQVNNGRIEVYEPGESNLDEKVGYLIEIDIRAEDDDPYFTVGPKSQRSPWGTWSGGIMINGVRVVSSTYAIKSDTFDPKQNKYIEKYVDNAMTALLNAVQGKGLQVIDENNTLVDSPYKNMYDTLDSFLDMDSFIKTCILQELMKNYDVGFGSFYLYVDFSATSKHKKLTFGAPWDFDLSSGNKQSGNIIKTDNEFIKSGFGEANFNPWLYLLSQTDFYDEIVKKYYTVLANSKVIDKAINQIKYGTEAYKNDFANDTERWKNGAEKTRMQTRQYKSQKDASTYLVDWLSKRQSYMDKVYLS